MNSLKNIIMSDSELNDWEPVGGSSGNLSANNSEPETMPGTLGLGIEKDSKILEPPFVPNQSNNKTSEQRRTSSMSDDEDMNMNKNLKESKLLPNERDFSDQIASKDIQREILEPIDTSLDSNNAKIGSEWDAIDKNYTDDVISNSEVKTLDSATNETDNDALKEENTSPSMFMNNMLQAFSLSSGSANKDNSNQSRGSSNPNSPNIISHRRNPSHTRKKSIKSNSNVPQSPSVSSPLQKVDHTKEKGEFDYDPNLYDKDKYEGTHFHYASYGRNVDFHNIFTSIPKEDRLLDEFNCTLSREFIYQGTLYVSESYLCFNSKILGWVSKVLISFREITYIDKTSSVGIFPNAISIETEQGKTQFNGFVSRDHAFDLIKEIWSRTLLAKNDEVEDNQSIDEKLAVVSEKEKSIPPSLNTSSGSSSSVSMSDYVRKIDNIDEVFFKLNERASRISYYGPYLITNEAQATNHDLEYETFLAEVNLDAPPGLAFQIMFNDPKAEFLSEYLSAQKATEVSNISKFDQTNDLGEKMRKYSYVKPLGFPVGPKSTICYAEDVIKAYEPRNYIDMITTTKTPKVPSGGNFSTKTRFLFTWQSERTCNLRISYWIDWSGSSWIKGIIESGCKTGQTDAIELLIPLAQKHIFENTEVSEISDNFDPYAIAEIEEDNELEVTIKLLTKKIEALTDKVEFIDKNRHFEGTISIGLSILIIILLLANLIVK